MLRWEFFGETTTTSESGICPRADLTFVPGIFATGTNVNICTGWGGRALVRPHVSHICTGLYHGPVQMCNGYNWLLLPPARATPLSTLSTRAPPPHGALGEFLPDLRRFLHDFTHWSGVEVSYFILPWYTVAVLSFMLCTWSISWNLEWAKNGDFFYLDAYLSMF